jgi:hypothetical protein
VSTQDPGSPGTAVPPEPRPRPGTLYGAGGTPAPPAADPTRDRLLIAAAAIGAGGVLLGALFASGLLPFGPDEPAASAPAAPGTSAPAPSGPTSPTPAAPRTPTGRATPTPPPAAPPTGTLRSAASSLCLDVGQGPVDGTPVQQVPCTGAPTQLWRLDRAGDVVTVINTATGGCLEVADGSPDNGAQVRLWSCQPVPHHRWRAQPAGSGFMLVGAASGKCLDVPGASSDQGVRMQQFDCNGTAAQQWVFGG